MMQACPTRHRTHTHTPTDQAHNSNPAPQTKLRHAAQGPSQPGSTSDYFWSCPAGCNTEGLMVEGLEPVG